MSEKTSRFHRVRSVYVLEPFTLRIVFTNNVEKEYDLRQWKERAEFALLFRNPAFVKSVRVDPGGYGISWNDQIDLHCEELWSRGNTIAEFV